MRIGRSLGATMENDLARFERKALSALRNINPDFGTLYEYMEITRKVDRVHAAFNRALLMMARESDRLDEIKAQQ